MLEGVNDPESLGSDVFGFRLSYNEDPYDNIHLETKFNGNISGMEWCSKDNASPAVYKYVYDDLSRLRSAKLWEWNNTVLVWDATTKYAEDNLYYDLNGNIQSVRRTNYNGTVVDNLDYDYDPQRGNMLLKVEDPAGHIETYDFTDGAHQAVEYQYDANGNMIADLNKGITIAYNYLNLPTSVTWADGRKITWLYDATGAKLTQSVYGPGGAFMEATDYVGGFEYRKQGTGPRLLTHFAFSEGRVVNGTSGFDYEYYAKDHLGNVRLSFKKDASLTPPVRIAQEDFYYPFGIRVPITTSDNKYLYNGKELVDQHGLNWYHYGARYYDPQLARWIEMDPADEFHTPYVYVGNDPVNLVDPDGAQVASYSDFEFNRYLNDLEASISGTPDDFLRGVGNALESIGPGLEAIFSADDPVVAAIEAFHQSGNFVASSIGRLVSGYSGHSAMEAYGQLAVIGTSLFIAPEFRASSKSNLGANPFRGKTFSQIDEMFAAKGFTTKGPDAFIGKGSYFSRSETAYWLDRGRQYKAGFEGPHVDIFYNGHPTLIKVKYFLDGSPKVHVPLKQ